MATLNAAKIQTIIEAALMVAGYPLTINNLQNLFSEAERPSSAEIRQLLQTIKSNYQDSGIELLEVASGFRMQAKAELSPWLAKLRAEHPPRYSRAFLETLAIIAYKQPITRAEIEAIRGVTVSSHIMKTLQELEWVRVLGFKETPGKPAIYGTSKTFLDHFNLKSLSDLPLLPDLKELTQDTNLQIQLAIANSPTALPDSETVKKESIPLENNQTASNDYE